jgi:cellulose synthase/poly-beta-1,6-N-acetylglucosamine synthase-like glycosyltransferase
MLVEKNFQPKNGFLALFVALACIAIGISIIVIYGDAESNIALWSLIPFLLFLIIAPGFKIVFRMKLQPFSFWKVCRYNSGEWVLLDQPIIWQQESHSSR